MECPYTRTEKRIVKNLRVVVIVVHTRGLKLLMVK